MGHPSAHDRTYAVRKRAEFLKMNSPIASLNPLPTFTGVELHRARAEGE